jgi:hypothetical protein
MLFLIIIIVLNLFLHFSAQRVKHGREKFP